MGDTQQPTSSSSSSQATDTVAAMKARSEGYAAEYQEIKELLQLEEPLAQEAGREEFNEVKNRYADIVPYDVNRVLLPTIEHEQGSDYINASFIKGFHGANAIIAAMGPKKETLVDFYRMLWTQNIKVIICLTGVKEDGKEKCAKYWPAKEESFGPFLSKFLEETYPNAADGADFCLRRFSVTLDGVTREMKQYHYHTWPDKGVPEYATPSLQMIDFARSIEPEDSGTPIVIHCSAGCGRTGAFCAIDFIRSKIKAEGVSAAIDIQALVADLRRQRPSMVQVPDQYKFIYEATIELLENADKIGKTKATNVAKIHYDKGEREAFEEQKRKNLEAAAARQANKGKKKGCNVM